MAHVGTCHARRCNLSRKAIRQLDRHPDSNFMKQTQIPLIHVL